ncbi:MAG: hypothetical protein JSS51_15370 [Planctomycetes bacterium]|nr:hypothetical protein [Planctomycetota bacterium]
MKPLAAAILLSAALCPLGCETVDERYSQTALNALQTREFDYPFDPTFDATVGALFDLGYTIRSSDKRGGFLSAVGAPGLVQIKLDQLGPSRTSVRVSTGASGQTRVDKKLIDQILNTIDRRLTTSNVPRSQ